MKNDFVEKIKLRGYWRINFQPVFATQAFSSLAECKNVVEKNKVILRGWDYPHFPQRLGNDTGLEPAGSHYVGWVDWNNHKEFWHMYKSSQFIHHLSLREDWLDEDKFHSETAKKIKPMTVINIIGTVVYQITEIYEFLSRLVAYGIYKEGVSVSISLCNTEGRELWISDFNRAGFLQTYKTGSEKIKFEKTYSKDEIIESSKENALEVILDVFDNFGWENPPVETLKKDQDNLLSGNP